MIKDIFDGKTKHLHVGDHHGRVYVILSSNLRDQCFYIDQVHKHEIVGKSPKKKRRKWKFLFRYLLLHFPSKRIIRFFFGYNGYCSDPEADVLQSTVFKKLSLIYLF